MRWCLYLKSNQNNLVWNELIKWEHDFKLVILQHATSTISDSHRFIMVTPFSPTTPFLHKSTYMYLFEAVTCYM